MLPSVFVRLSVQGRQYEFLGCAEMCHQALRCRLRVDNFAKRIGFGDSAKAVQIAGARYVTRHVVKIAFWGVFGVWHRLAVSRRRLRLQSFYGQRGKDDANRREVAKEMSRHLG
jgi:hypothetical protein